MGGFADTFGAAANQPVSSFDNGALKGGMVSAGGPRQALVPKSQAGGVGGFLYNNLIQPVASGIANTTANVAGLAGAAGHELLQGPMQGMNNNMASSYLKSTPAGQAVSDYQTSNPGASTGKLAEVAAGSAGSDLLNAASPFVGGEALAGKVGLKALMGAGAKTGAALGGASGIANAASQGGSATDLATGGLTGGVAGAALGAGGGALGAGLGKLAGSKVGSKVAGVANKEVGNGKLAQAARQTGLTKANNIQAKAADKAGFNLPQAQTAINNTASHDTFGQPVSYQEVQGFLHGVNMTPDSNGVGLGENMQVLHDIGNQTIGDHIIKATDGITVDASNASTIGSNAVRSEVGNLGKISKNGTGDANAVLAQVRNDTKGLSTNSSVKDVMDAISQLTARRTDLSSAVQAGDTKAIGRTAVYSAVIKHLDGVLNNAKVNQAIAAYKIPLEEANAIRADVIGAGGSHELADHLINTVDQAKNYAQNRSAMQLPTIAGRFAKAARDAQSNVVPQVATGTSTAVRGIAPELAIAAGHPGYLPFALSRLASQGYQGAKGAIARTLAPGAYKSGLAEGLAPNENTAAKLNLGGPGGTPPPTTPPVAGGTPPPTTAPLGAGRTFSPLGALIGASATGANAGGGAPAPQLPTDQGAQQQVSGGGPGEFDKISQLVDQFTNNGQTDASQQQPKEYSLQAMESDISRDPAHASTYETLYKDLQSAEAPPKATAAQVSSAQAISDGMAALKSAIQGYQSMGGTGIQNAPGELPLVGGLIEPNVKAFQQTRIDLATSLAKALTGRSAVPKTLIDQYLNSIPSPTDPPAKAESMMNKLYNQLYNKASAESISNPAAAQLIGVSNGQ